MPPTPVASGGVEAHPVGKVPPRNADAIRAALAARQVAEAEVRRTVLEALAAGGSVREVAKVAGVAPSTVQRWSTDR